MPSFEQSVSNRLKALEKKVNTKQTSGGGFWLSMAPYSATSPFSSSPVVTYIVTIPRDGIVMKCQSTVYVQTTNSASHFWSFFLNTAGSTIGTANTQTGILPDDWYRLEIPLTANPTEVTAGTDLYFSILAQKTGTPGNLILASPVLFFV